jgi:RNA polymerase sigma factor (sigma-70 family)
MTDEMGPPAPARDAAGGSRPAAAPGSETVREVAGGSRPAAAPGSETVREVAGGSRPAAAPAWEAGPGAPLASLVAAAQAGHPEAVGDLVTQLSPLLWHTARAAGLAAADAEDVVQTVWLRLMSSLPAIHTPSALTAWLVTTTRREAWRISAARRRQVSASQEWLAALPDPQPGGEDQAVAGDQRRELWAAMRRLPPRCQALLRILAFVPRPDYGAVAAALGMPRGSIGPTRGRCLAKLRTVLRAGGQGATE